jgi:hypothetical protein
MPDYRIYLLNTESHIIAVRQADCADDAAALASAAEAIDGHAGAEVWQRARLVSCRACASRVRTRLAVAQPIIGEDRLRLPERWRGQRHRPGFRQSATDATRFARRHYCDWGGRRPQPS